MTHQRMDEDHEEIVAQEVEKLMGYLYANVPRSKVYSHVNICMNILLGGLFTLAINHLPAEMEDEFIKNIVIQLRACFYANRKNKKSS